MSVHSLNRDPVFRKNVFLKIYRSFIYVEAGKRASASFHGKRSPPPMNIRISKGIAKCLTTGAVET